MPKAGFNVQGEGWKTFACSSILKFRKQAAWWRKYAFQKTPRKLLQTKIKKNKKQKIKKKKLQEQPFATSPRTLIPLPG